MVPAAGDESALGDAIAEWLELQREGKAPPADEFAARRPEIAETLRSCLGALALLRPDADPSGATPRVLGDFRIVRLIGRGGIDRKSVV